MTAARMPHLPQPDDASFQRALDALEDEGLDLSPRRRTVLATAKEFGLFDGPDGILGILRDAMVATTPEVRAAHARRVVRENRDAAEAEARYHRSAYSVPPRVWRLSEDQLSFTHVRCGQDFGPFIDARQATEQAVAHDKECEVRRG